MSAGPVSIEHRGDVAVVTVDSPPVNAAGHAVRAGLMAAVDAIGSDAAIRGAVLLCAGRTFVAGADIAEFGAPPAPPLLADVCAALDALAKPVVAALHGSALGGGLELALACPYRVIEPAANLGLPEVTLGLIPGAGGTQRLPRLVGAAAALDLIVSGRKVGAAEALRLGAVDAITVGDRLGFALGFLRERLDRPVPHASSRPCPALPAEAVAALRAAVAKRSPGQIAPQRAIDVVAESGARDFASGLSLEAEAFGGLRASPQARAMRHVFFAERAVAKVPELSRASARAVTHLGVVGGGTMGAGIAAAGLLAGLRVHLVERDDAALAAGRERVEAILRDAANRGKLSAESHADIGAGRFSATAAPEPLRDADLIVEAVFESMDAKRDVFAILDRLAKPGAILATNTSYLDVAAIAAATSRPADVIGLHFFSPAHVMRLLEIVVPPAASAQAVATGFAFGRALGKIAVRAGNAEGFIGNRILSAYRKAADAMVEDGASPWEVDAAVRAFGFPLGLFEMQDLAGLDIGWATRKRLAATRDPAERYARVSDRICERGRFGRKSGRGYYVYADGRAEPDPEVDAIVADERRAKGIAPRPFSPEEIQERVLLATVNEGAKVLDEGVALRASDIDVVMVDGYGFPRWRGGPMHAADERGLGAIVDGLRRLEAEDAQAWRPAPLLVRLAEQGRRFDAFAP